MIRIAVRGYTAGSKIFEELREIDDGEDDEKVWTAMADDHMRRLGGPETPFMIEIEFLDEPNVNHRFFRVGTDPSRMQNPMAVLL